MDSVLNALKPVGMTSHDVVDFLRRTLHVKKVGHTGTLDPGAAGVLVLCLGRATRIAEFLVEADKEYRVEATFGVATRTGDAYGEVTRDVDAAGVDEGRLREVLARFVGRIQQVPPMASAVHHQGKRLYALARKGVEVEVPPREVTIHNLELLALAPGTRPRALLHIVCSKGTYVRRLCADVGETLGCGAHASFMVRTRVGRYRLEHALTLAEVGAGAEAGRLAGAVDDLDTALGDFPAVTVTTAQRQHLLSGQAVPLWRIPGWEALPRETPVRVRDERGLLALATVQAGRLRPFKVLR